MSHGELTGDLSSETLPSRCNAYGEEGKFGGKGEPRKWEKRESSPRVPLPR